MGANDKLKVQLKLAVTRLKMLQQKKAALSGMQRKEISMLLEKGKEESARIRVEHIIREDYNVEAMEMLELYCELLLARFGLIEQYKQLDESIKEAVSTLMYSANRVDCKELGVIRDLLTARYGKEYAHSVLTNATDVNDRIVEKLRAKPPPKKLVNQYLTEIAKSYNVNWSNPESDIDISESQLDSFLASPDDILPVSKGPGSGGNSGSGGSGGGGSYSSYPTFGEPPKSNVPSKPSQPPSSSSQSSSFQPYFPDTPSQPNPGPSVFQTFPPAYGSSQMDFPDPPKVPLDSNSHRSGDSIPSFPSVPSQEDDENGDGDSPDFDELTKRFEALKKR